MLAPTTAPLILTLLLDAAAQAHFDELRQQHFPAERNYLGAHLTLFHHLPGLEQASISTYLRALAATQPPLPLAVTGLRFLGRGVAFSLSCPPLQVLHRTLQTTWQAKLTPQDQQKLNPHVTIQNKVDPAVARGLHQQLTAEFQPFNATGTGLQLWAYRGGPWELLEVFNFTDKA